MDVSDSRRPAEVHRGRELRVVARRAGPRELLKLASQVPLIGIPARRRNGRQRCRRRVSHRARDGAEAVKPLEFLRREPDALRKRALGLAIGEPGAGHDRGHGHVRVHGGKRPQRLPEPEVRQPDVGEHLHQ